MITISDGPTCDVRRVTLTASTSKSNLNLTYLGFTSAGRDTSVAPEEVILLITTFYSRGRKSSWHQNVRGSQALQNTKASPGSDSAGLSVYHPLRRLKSARPTGDGGMAAALPEERPTHISLSLSHISLSLSLSLSHPLAQDVTITWGLRQQ